MACFRPLFGYRSAERNPDTGKRSIVFKASEGLYDLPVTLPCGQCIGCRLERSRQWAIRCMHEASLHEHNCFITLTYDQDKLPVFYRDDGPMVGNLQLKDFQLFMYKLRKRKGAGIRFFHAGEYGENFGRPHYHAILFNCHFSDKKLWKRQECGDLYVSEELQAIWGNGKCIIGDVTFDSAAYVARYCVKKVTGEAADAHYQGRTPEYTTMSRRPGIGRGWYEKWRDNAYPRDFVVMRGRAMKPPKAYDRFFELDCPDSFASVKRKRMAATLEDWDSENSPERLRIREVVQKSNIDSLKRSI